MINYNTWYISADNLWEILSLSFWIVYKEFPKKDNKEHELLLKKYNNPFWYWKKFDFAFEYKNILYIVEFDWFWHYTNPDNILRDDWYRTNLNKNVKFISIPYFIQLNKYTIPVLFSFLENPNDFKTVYNWVDYSKFPCWFWSDYAVKSQTPAFFCKLWIERYEEDVKRFPIEVRNEIDKSLKRCELELKKDRRVIYY